VTSVEAETGERHSVKTVADIAARHLAELFDRSLVWTHAEWLMGKVDERDDHLLQTT
jgi:hypothetical protein